MVSTSGGGPACPLHGQTGARGRTCTQPPDRSRPLPLCRVTHGTRVSLACHTCGGPCEHSSSSRGGALACGSGKIQQRLSWQPPSRCRSRKQWEAQMAGPRPRPQSWDVRSEAAGTCVQAPGDWKPRAVLWCSIPGPYPTSKASGHAWLQPPSLRGPLLLLPPYDPHATRGQRQPPGPRQ